MSKIIKCNCKSEFQDKQYGLTNIVHTEGNKGLTCTVCGNKTDGNNQNTINRKIKRK